MKRGRFRRCGLWGLFCRLYILVVLVLIIFPLLWMFSLSFRSSGGLHKSYFFIFPQEIDMGNYARAMQYTNELGYSVITIIKNSILITTVSVFLTIAIATLAGYAFAKFKFNGRNKLLYFILFGMMIPIQILIIPIFVFTKYSGLLNTYLSIILPYIALGLPFSIFIMRGFFLGISNSMIEAAKIDGAREFGIFFKIALPLARPAIAACVIFLFLMNYNEFILALVLLLRKNLLTVPVGLSKMLGEYVISWGQYSALVFMTSIPIIVVFVIFQNWFIKGLTLGSVKG